WARRLVICAVYYTDRMRVPERSQRSQKPILLGSVNSVCSVVLSLTFFLATSGFALAQTRKPAARSVPSGPPIREAPQMTCPAPLGSGVTSKQPFCDVLIGRDPAAGILITIPPHRGDVTLTFDLHNRHTFSEEQMKDPRAAYARYTASVGA